MSEPVRVLHVLTAMNRAGTETMLMNLYRAIDRNIIQFDFAVTSTNQCDYDEEIKRLGGNIIHYPLYIGKNHFSYKKWWNSFFECHPEYKIVHGHIGSTASIYLKIAKKYGRYTIAHSHSTGSGFGFHNILYRLYSFPTRYIADYCIGCSTEALKRRYGVNIVETKKWHVLPNGIDVEQYKIDSAIRKNVLSELGISENHFVFGTVGRLTPPKNPLFILDILSELKKKMPDFIFLWAGTGAMKEQIEKGIVSRGLQDNVKLLGVRDDVPKLLQVFHVFILPSVFEGLPVVGVEVQAAGVPMLCSDKVSPEVNMSKCCSFLPIDSVEPWVAGILKEKEFRRIEDAHLGVSEAGYDIKATSEWLTQFYLLHCKRGM